MQIALEKLPVAERLQIIEQLWDSIVDDCEKHNTELDLPEHHKMVLDERLAQHQLGQAQYEDRHVMMQKIRSQLGI